MLEVCRRINNYLHDNKVYEQVDPYGLDLPVVEIEISWGDWKHDHLRLKWLMDKIGCPCVNTIVTEENGSDCYSAIHRFIIKEDTLQVAA